MNDERARAVVASCNEPIVVLDSERRIVAASDAAASALGSAKAGRRLDEELAEAHPEVLVLFIEQPPELPAYQELRIDPLEVQAYVDDQSAGLTPTEFRLLYQLALDRGRVVTRDELLQKLWGRRESHRDRTVDVFVRRLREKVDRPASTHTFIQTRYGVGYRLEPVPKAARGHAAAAR